MANIEISTLTRNNDGNTYVIKDANAIPKSGANDISGDLIPSTDNSIDVGSSTKNLKMLYTKGITIDGKTIDTDANGNMTYDSHIVDTIEEQGNGYIRYSNGLQICWGVIKGAELEPFNGHYGKLISYPKSFLANTNPIVNISQWREAGNLTQNFNMYTVSESYVGIETDNGWGVYYTVFGMWK